MAGTTSKPSVRLLCEGWIEEGADSAAVFLPEVGYVTQGDKVWVAFGEAPKSLHESEGVNFVTRLDEMELEEHTLSTGAKVRLPKNGRWIVEGPGQRSDVKNANQRVYPRKIWERLISDPNSYVQRSIKERAMLGHLEHPKDGRSDLNEAAILTVHAELKEDGTVFNRFELLDTPKGRILQELTAKGVRWGVSSRGNGSVDDAGRVSESDYVLKTWDAVAAPSTPGAYPGLGESENSETRSQRARPERVKAVCTALKTLVESDHDGLDRKSREKRSDSILRVLASIDETTASGLLSSPDWKTVMSAINHVRELNAEGNDLSERLDEAIEETLVSGEASESEGLMHVVESLQEQVANSVEEQNDLQRRLEAAESDRRELHRVHESCLEQLSVVREELSEMTRQRDLANELLSEASARRSGDGRVAAKVAELVAERPALAEYQTLLSEAVSVEQAVSLADLIVPRAPLVEDEPAYARRTSLPVGMVESYDPGLVESVHSTPTSAGARLAGAAMSATQNART